MAIGESSQIRTSFCRNYLVLRALLDQTIGDLKRSFENIRVIQDEKKTLGIKIEVCVVERDLLDEENFQLKDLLKNTRKSPGNISLLVHTSRLVLKANILVCLALIKLVKAPLTTMGNLVRLISNASFVTQDHPKGNTA